MASPELTVQIVNYKTRAYLRPCLDSLVPALRASGRSWGIALLENGSGDDLGEFAAEAHVVVSEENLGFGGGHNRLAATHDSPVICVLNPDVVFDDEDAFATLLAALDREGVVATGPLLRTPE